MTFYMSVRIEMHRKYFFIGLYVAYANLLGPKDLGDSYCEDFGHHRHPRFDLKMSK